MKAFYDKLFLALGIIVLIAGCAFYVMRSGAVTSAETLLAQQPGGPAYEAVAAPELEITQPKWPDPVAQDRDGLQIYDIFTPPKIYWDPIKGELVFQPVEEPEPPTPFGLELVSIERELFRVQLEAFFLSPEGTMEDSTVQFFNTKLGESIRGKMGDEFPEHGFSITDVKYRRVVLEEEGSTTIRRVPTVTIVDLDQNGREIVLTTESKLFLEGKLTITLRTLPPYEEAEFNWKQVGDTYQSGDATFTLQSFNFDNKTVTVEKTAPDLETPEVLTLSETAPRPAMQTESDTETETVTEANEDDSTNNLSQGFENFFN